MAFSESRLINLLSGTYCYIMQIHYYAIFQVSNFVCRAKHVPEDDVNYIAQQALVLHCYRPLVRNQQAETINETPYRYLNQFSLHLNTTYLVHILRIKNLHVLSD